VLRFNGYDQAWFLLHCNMPLLFVARQAQAGAELRSYANAKENAAFANK
jgi:hypothetical protein